VTRSDYQMKSQVSKRLPSFLSFPPPKSLLRDAPHDSAQHALRPKGDAVPCGFVTVLSGLGSGLVLVLHYRQGDKLTSLKVFRGFL
jgi:hypothetical protein